MNKCANAKCQISDLYKIRANFLTSLPNIYFRIRSLGPACAFEPILMPPTIVRVTATTVYYKRVVFTGRPEKGIQFDSLHTLFDTENWIYVLMIFKKKKNSSSIFAEECNLIS